ncbi:hypothetical protein AHAS_Ahas05G0080700 [Arachis hypogaea]
MLTTVLSVLYSAVRAGSSTALLASPPSSPKSGNIYNLFVLGNLVLEHILLLETYTKDSIPALHKIRKYLVEATEEASIAYNKAVCSYSLCLQFHG